MAVGDGLARRIDGADEPTSEYYGIQSHLEQLQQPDTGVATLPGCFSERVLHLAFADVVVGPKPLLLHQLLAR